MSTLTKDMSKTSLLAHDHHISLNSRSSEQQTLSLAPKSHNKTDSSAELWDLITGAGTHEPKKQYGYRNKYEDLQRNRTLHHPRLPQPSPDVERVHLSKVSLTSHGGDLFVLPEDRRRNGILTDEAFDVSAGTDATQENIIFSPSKSSFKEQNNNEPLDADAELRSRLSAALLGGNHNSNGDKGIIEDFPSPTSTLNFPAPTPLHPKLVSEWQLETHHANDFVIGGYDDSQVDRLDEMLLCREVTEIDRHSPSHSFVVCADSQVGMTSMNDEWETELQYCRQAVKAVNSLHPRPAFVCVCGDIVDMESSFHRKSGAKFSQAECDVIQDKQNEDFKRVFSEVHEDIAVLCVCGNHDIGNRPTPASIERFTNAFGDDYLAFWVNGTYNIALNNVLFSDPTGAPENFNSQLIWLEDRLRYAREHDAACIYVFAHHPWFLYHEDEEMEELKGSARYPKEWGESDEKFPDYYFHIPKNYRMMALDLFRKYDVSASFAGHFHRNLVSKTSWGMDMIITAPLSILLESDGNTEFRAGKPPEKNGRGIRIVEVKVDKKGKGRFTHRFDLLD